MPSFKEGGPSPEDMGIRTPEQESRNELTVPKNFWQVVDKFRMDTIGFGGNRPNIDSWLAVLDDLARHEPGSVERRNKIKEFHNFGTRLELILDWPKDAVVTLVKVLEEIKYSDDINFKPNLETIKGVTK